MMILKGVREKVLVLGLLDKKVSHDLQLFLVRGLHLTILTTLTYISHIIYSNRTFQPSSLISHGYHFPDDPFNKKSQGSEKCENPFKNRPKVLIIKTGQ